MLAHRLLAQLEGGAELISFDEAGRLEHEGDTDDD